MPSGKQRVSLDVWSLNYYKCYLIFIVVSKFPLIINRYEVLQQLSRGSYSLVLMDCMMPRLDGYATTKMIRECCNVANLPLATSSSSGPDSVTSAMRSPSLVATPMRSPSLTSNPIRSPSLAHTLNISSDEIPKCRGRRPSIATIPHGIPVVAMTGIFSFPSSIIIKIIILIYFTIC